MHVCPYALISLRMCVEWHPINADSVTDDVSGNLPFICAPAFHIRQKKVKLAKYLTYTKLSMNTSF